MKLPLLSNNIATGHDEKLKAFIFRDISWGLQPDYGIRKGMKFDSVTYSVI